MLSSSSFTVQSSIGVSREMNELMELNTCAVCVIDEIVTGLSNRDRIRSQHPSVSVHYSPVVVNLWVATSFKEGH